MIGCSWGGLVVVDVFVLDPAPAPGVHVHVGVDFGGVSGGGRCR